MVNNVEAECSFDNWYKSFSKESLEAIILPLTAEILKYLEHDAFILPKEATSKIACNSEWSDGASVTEDSSNVKNTLLYHVNKRFEKYKNCFSLLLKEPENTPSFPELSQKIQQAIDEFQAIFIKSNWSTPSVRELFPT